MTVQHFQKIDRIKQTSLDDLDCLARLICEVFNLSPEIVNSFTYRQLTRYATKLERTLRVDPLFFKACINTDATKITLGQFIEVMEWNRRGTIACLHLIIASLINGKNHQRTAAKILQRNIRRYHHIVMEFNASLDDLLMSYKGLFELDEQEDEVKTKKSSVHPFIANYGWIYSATEIAEHEKINLEQAFNLPIIQALNTLSFLKSKSSYMKWLHKQ